TEILQLNKALTGTLSSKPYKIGVLSNVTVNSFREILEYNCRVHQIEPVVEIGNFDNIVQDSAQSADKNMVIIFYELLSVIDDLGIVFNGISDEAFEAIQNKLCSEIDIILANLASIPSIVFNLFSAAAFPASFQGPAKAEQLAATLNDYLLQRKTANLTLIDINKIISGMGQKQAYDFRFYASSKAPYSVAFLKEYTLAIQSLLLKNNGKLKKALIFDCDNTLWKGILGEDGIDGIQYDRDQPKGKYFHQVQQLAAWYSKLGILIGLCSKNNAADVDEVLLQSKTALTNDQIVIKKVNWEDKASNLRAIAADLNIGIDSLVFIDDSSFEINLIKEQVPEILTLQVPQNIAEYPDQLQRLVQQYFSLELNKEDAAKTAMYKQNFERESSKTAFTDIEGYLASLGIVITLSENDAQQIPRLAQLTQKTNQFNLTTKRYTEQQVQQFMEQQGGRIFALSVRDKFGDSGLTGMAIVVPDEQDEQTAVIDSFLLSCRVIGRNIEYAFLNYIIDGLKASGFKRVQASFAPTKKNEQVSAFYENAGMQSVERSDDGGNSYTLELTAGERKTYPYIAIEQAAPSTTTK
ncbi:MAG: HAD-IIIC family phosphatase, partial [Sphingobacteriales bacterium]